MRLADVDLIRWMSAAEDATVERTYRVPAGDYRGLRFGLGVKPELNARDPSNFPADYVLNETEFWGPATRYVFAKIEGNAMLEDDGRFDTGLSYHMGSDALYTTVSLNHPFSLDDAEAPRLTIVTDVLQALSGGGRALFGTGVGLPPRDLSSGMQNLNYPLTFTFKVGTLANDFTATDTSGRVVAYVRQKMLRLKEDIQVYSDERRSRVLYNIRADRWLDWSAAYAFYDERGTEFGKVARKGWRSLWKAEYEIVDRHDQPQYKVQEENGWVKVIDSVLGEVPVLGMLTGYFFHPSYLATDRRGREIARLSKQPSFFGRKFRVDKLVPVEGQDDDRIMLGLMMLILLERRRG